MATPTTNGSIVKKPLLTLHTITERDFITIDGTPYDLLKPNQLTLTAFHRVNPYVDRFSTLMDAKTLAPEESDELSAILKVICSVAITAPTAVQEALTDDDRLQVVVAFVGLSQLLRTLSRAAETTPQTSARRSTGSKPSRGSAGSTRARRTTG